LAPKHFAGACQEEDFPLPEGVMTDSLLLKMAIEIIEIVDLPIENGDFP